MNRPIKFRVWDSVGEKWMEFYEIDILDQQYFQNPEYVVQQFTGLLDKNGREIYEGDIVKIPLRGFISDKSENPLNYETHQQIVFISGYFGFSNLRYDDCQIMPIGFNTGILGSMTLNYSCEVIGNIFENPELI